MVDVNFSRLDNDTLSSAAHETQREHSEPLFVTPSPPPTQRIKREHSTSPSHASTIDPLVPPAKRINRSNSPEKEGSTAPKLQQQQQPETPNPDPAAAGGTDSPLSPMPSPVGSDIDIEEYCSCNTMGHACTRTRCVFPKSCWKLKCSCDGVHIPRTCPNLGACDDPRCKFGHEVYRMRIEHDHKTHHVTKKKIQGQQG